MSTIYTFVFHMRIIAKKPLRAYWEKHTDCKKDLQDWYEVAKKTDWASPNEVKKTYPKASIVANNRVAFNIAGNNYRLVIQFAYKTRIGYVRFIGTHSEYDKINVTEI